MPTTDTIASIMERDPWQTPMGLASMAVVRAEEAAECLRLAPASRRELHPEAVRQLVRGRRFVLDARALLGSQSDREQLAYLDLLLDAVAEQLGFQVRRGVA